MRTTPFARHLVRYLRVTFFLIVGVVGLVAAYALILGEDAAWEIVIFLAVGMILSSLMNAALEARREKNG